jgi:hypothetical protein
VVINRYPTDTPGLAEETNPRAIEKWGTLAVVCLVPEVKDPIGLRLPDDVVAAVGAVDWEGVLRREGTRG